MSTDWLEKGSDELCYFDSEEFQDYVKLLETQLKSTDTVSVGNIRGMTIGELHRRLGDEARREWTMDALSYIDSLMYEGHPSRYWISSRPNKIVIRIGGSVVLSEVDRRGEWESKNKKELSCQKANG
jgi:hypothetical protein